MLQAGFAGGPFAEQELDSKSGFLGWRPLERSIRRQGCGKLRLTDSGKLLGRRDATQEFETVFTSTVVFIPAVISRIFELLAAAVWIDVEVSGPWFPQATEVIF